jgi:hypothetical protein
MQPLVVALPARAGFEFSILKLRLVQLQVRESVTAAILYHNV